MDSELNILSETSKGMVMVMKYGFEYILKEVSQLCLVGWDNFPIPHVYSNLTFILPFSVEAEDLTLPIFLILINFFGTKLSS